MTPKQLQRKLEKLQYHIETGRRSYTRYSWRPGTETGRKDHERSADHFDKAHAIIEELKGMLK